MDITLNVNEINKMVAEKLGYEFCNTEKAEIASIANQYKPKEFTLGGGSVLTITFNLSGKLKENQ